MRSFAVGWLRPPLPEVVAGLARRGLHPSRGPVLRRGGSAREESPQTLLGPEPKLLVALPETGRRRGRDGPAAGGVAPLLLGGKPVELRGSLRAAQHPHPERLDLRPVAEILRNRLGEHD